MKYCKVIEGKLHDSTVKKDSTDNYTVQRNYTVRNATPAKLLTKIEHTDFPSFRSVKSKPKSNMFPVLNRVSFLYTLTQVLRMKLMTTELLNGLSKKR